MKVETMTTNERRLRRMMKGYNRERARVASLRENIAECQQMANNGRRGGMLRTFYELRVRSMAYDVETTTAALDSLDDVLRRGLPPADRELVRLHYVDGLSWYKAARKLSLCLYHIEERGEAAFRSLASRIAFRPLTDE